MQENGHHPSSPAFTARGPVAARAAETRCQTTIPPLAIPPRAITPLAIPPVAIPPLAILPLVDILAAWFPIPERKDMAPQ